MMNGLESKGNGVAQPIWLSLVRLSDEKGVKNTKKAFYLFFELTSDSLTTNP